MRQIKSILKQLETVFREEWESPAFSDYGKDRSFTYGEVATRISYIHCLFAELGIKPGDRVIICDRNSSNWAISFLAIITYQAVAVPLLPDYSDAQLVMLCEHCNARFIICSRSLSKLWPAGECPMYMLDIEDLLTMNPDRHTDAVEEAAFTRYAEKYPKRLGPDNLVYGEEDPDAMMLLSYTSGSTGNPKGVMLSYRSILINILATNRALPVTRHAKVLCILPNGHMFGLVMDMLFGACAAAHQTMVSMSLKRALPAALLEVRPDYLNCVPLIMERMFDAGVKPYIEQPEVQAMLQDPEKSEAVYGHMKKLLLDIMGGSIRQVMLGGAPLNRELETMLSKMKFPYAVAYGMTECGPLISFNTWQTQRLGSCGRLIEGMDARILSDDPFNEPGELIVRGPNVMMGYYRNQTATSDNIDPEGWLSTGDYGVFDQDGYLYLRGRKKNMLLNSNGQNVYPEEAEGQVVSHSIFEEAVVVKRGEELVALVYVSDERLKEKGLTRGSLDLAAICREVNMHLPRYCQLGYMEQMDTEFEKTPKNSIRRFKYQ